MIRNQVRRTLGEVTALAILFGVAFLISPLMTTFRDPIFSLAWDPAVICITAVFFLVALYFIKKSGNNFDGFIEPVVLLAILGGSFLSAMGSGLHQRYLIVLAALLAFLAIRASRQRLNVGTLVILLATVLCLHAVWAIAQFGIQADFGHQAIGETDFSAGAGVATFSVTEELKLTRGYGGFAHPNALAGTIALSVTGLLLVVHKKYTSRSSLNWSIYSVPISALLTTLTLGVAVSFSRVGITALILSWSIFFLHERHALKRHRVLIITLLVTLIVFTPLFAARQYDSADKGISDRIASLSNYEMLARHLGTPTVFGVGLGGYASALKQALDAGSLEYDQWDIAPIHSIAPLLYIELGVLLTVALAVALLFLLSRIRPTNLVWLLPVIPIAIFDHYLVTQLAPMIALLILIELLRYK